MTRIIAGTARGRRIAVPAGVATRPTSDRVREGLFNTVESRLGPLRGVWVLDLYAGSGAVGLEALSRGADHALMVESSRAAVRVIKGNIAAVGLPGAQVVAGDVGRVVARGPRGEPGGASAEEEHRPRHLDRPRLHPTGKRVLDQSPAQYGHPRELRPTEKRVLRQSPGRYGFVFVDPPYGVGGRQIALVLEGLMSRGWLMEGALVAVERGTGTAVLWPAGYREDRVRRYGDTTLWYGLAAGR